MSSLSISKSQQRIYSSRPKQINHLSSILVENKPETDILEQKDFIEDEMEKFEKKLESMQKKGFSTSSRQESIKLTSAGGYKEIKKIRL
jgi:hypothetical protein